MYDVIKRVGDVLFALLLLVITLPITVPIALLFFWINSGNPFFVQMRPGKGGRIFQLIKFKTMTDQKDRFGQLLPDEKRLTRFGYFLRRTSLDELPQLINVVKGDMSVVGPRPLLPEYLPLYDSTQFRRHEVRPGITGWAQVNGRNALPWERKFEMDVWYVDNYSFLVDIKIMLLTIRNVFLAKGINMEGYSTTLPFKGN
ncbi:sugar transferase [Sediminibacterium soli]|uniref:sugar transferase n=1 Tax=Sediminibacterium soli TaxID=2698829 RepID=UPI00137A009B|nr:sugar transferase [Sediminibacterium soli]NCI48065.1 sugar transferase [Sediminibacterium soli]